MTLGPIVDVAIGLIFVYLLLGLMTTAFQEVLSNMLKWRGKMLRDALVKLLSDGKIPSELFGKVYGHGLIAGSAATTHPSYIASRNFALALVDTLGDGSNAPIFSQVENAIGTLPNGHIKEAMRVLVQQAGGDLDAVKSSLATWYDDAMDRLSGRYKRKSQIVAIVFGACLAVALNIDSIAIGARLWNDDALRAKISAAAQAYSDQAAKQGTKGQLPADFRNDLDALQKLDLPIGWKDEHPLPPGTNQFVEAFHAFTDHFGSRGFGRSVLVVIGWVLTALATSLGAPFWFDMLQKFLSLRGTGPKPARAGDPHAN